jgi:hypothetical protein
MTEDSRPTAQPEKLAPSTDLVENQDRSGTPPAVRPDAAARPWISVRVDGGCANVRVGKKGDAADHAALMRCFGTTDPVFFDGLLHSIINAAKDGGTVTDESANFIASVVAAVVPRDELEAMLAVQMAAIHNATIVTARRLAHVETLPQFEAHERALNKLARTYTTQLEALKRYRTGGQQKVVVEHVTVNAGGQAIVGAVSHSGGGAPEKAETTS